jgi:hypothetical protein
MDAMDLYEREAQKLQGQVRAIKRAAAAGIAAAATVTAVLLRVCTCLHMRECEKRAVKALQVTQSVGLICMRM